MKTNNKLPGKLGEMSGIPLAITEEHHHVFPYWNNFGIKDAILIHVDSHPDLADESVPAHITFPKMGLNLSEDYYKKLSIGNFICPAAHYRIINEVFWISPFQKGSEIYLQHINGNSLDTKTTIGGRIKWKNFSDKVNGTGASMNEEDGKYGKSLNLRTFKKFFKENKKRDSILDIDLDAFAKEIPQNSAITQMVYALNPGFGIDGWEKRIKETKALLKKVPKPNLITLTRSQGKHNYVPHHLVDKVQEETIEMLQQVYRKRMFS